MNVIFRIGLVIISRFEHFLLLQPTLGGSRDLSWTSCRSRSRSGFNGILIRAKKSIKSATLSRLSFVDLATGNHFLFLLGINI